MSSVAFETSLSSHLNLIINSSCAVDSVAWSVFASKVLKAVRLCCVLVPAEYTLSQDLYRIEVSMPRG